MEKINALRWIAGALVVLGTAAAYAQGGDTDAAALPSAGSVPSAKAQRKADRLLAKEVRHTLVRVKGLDSGGIVVFARRGAVTLGGSVPEPGQITSAVSAAKDVKGVDTVKNSLTVKALGQ